MPRLTLPLRRSGALERTLIVPQSNEPADEKYALRSVSRALDVLETLGGSSEGLGVGEIAERIGVSRSTAFTLLQTLVARGFVADVRIGGARLYRLGMSLVHLGDRALSELGIVQIASPVLQQLTNATQLTSRLAVLDEGCAVAVGRVDAPGPIRVTASLGRRELPHTSAMGKALLSGLTTEKVMDIVERLGMPKRTERTLTIVPEFLRDLEESRSRGYALDREEDNVGIICVGAPIYGRSAETIAAISVTGIRLDRTDADMHELGVTVRGYADRVSLLLGGPTHAALLTHPKIRGRRVR